MSANKDYAIVQVDPYKACLKTRGWLRAQSPEPPADWFRGIEREEVVRLDSLTPPTSPRRAALTSTAAAVGADLVGTWTGSLVQRSPIFGTRTYAASLRITEVGSALRGALQVSGFDLTGSGDVVRSGTETSLSGRFGRRALPITFTLAVNGTALEANGLGADNQLYRLALERRQ